MELFVFNSSGRKKEKFIPINQHKIGLYVCGPTIYDHLHVGNGRALIVYDVLYRLLKHIYKNKKITYVRNITDVEDKIIARAEKLGITPAQLVKKTGQDFKQVLEYTRCLPPTYQPRASDHIGEMIEMIKSLLDNGCAYKSTSGDIYFKVSSYPEYNKLSARDDSSIKEAVRIERDDKKQHHADFVLWKMAAPHDSTDTTFDSPFGRGRPGWHIECSAMSTKFLGADFDIHGGGIDLIFPHHTNEIAQSCCANPGSNYAKYWIHNGFVKIGGDKMSKSAGNMVNIKDVEDSGISGSAFRLAMLSSHYHKPMNFSDKLLEDSSKILQQAARATAGVQIDDQRNLSARFLEPMLDNMNTPLYIKNMVSLTREINKESDTKTKSKLASELARAMDFLGLKQDNNKKSVLSDEYINNMIEKRETAKLDKNWQLADSIRDELQNAGIMLEDTKDGTKWRAR